MWEDLLASCQHKAVFLALTVSGTRNDSLLELKVVRTFEDIHSDHLSWPDSFYAYL